MLCTSCKKEIDDQAKFCPHCGAPVTAPPMQTDPPAETAPAPEPEKPPKPKKEKRQKKQKPSDPSVSAPSEKPAANPGAALMTAFLLIELLPYLLRSVLMLVTKTVLPVPVSCLCGIAGFLAAGGILAFFSKRAGGRAPLSAAVLFTSLFAVGRTAVPFILAASESGKTLRAMIVYAAAAAVVLLLTVLLVIPLGTLFISDAQKHRGKFAAFLCVLLALAVPGILDTFVFLIPAEIIPSFMGTASVKMLTAVLEAGCFALGANAMRRRTTEKAAKSPKKMPALIAGGCAAVGSAVLLFLGTGPQNVVKTAQNDIVYPLVQAELIMAGGDMTAAMNYYNLAGAHANAWASLAKGSSPDMPKDYCNDTMLRYLYFLGSTNDLPAYMVTELDPSEIRIFGPLALENYKQRESMSETETALRREILDLCIGSGVFVNNYPTLRMIEKNSDQLSALSQVESRYSKYLRIAEIFSGMQRADASVSSSIGKLLDIAEEYPEDLRIQAIAMTIGSENRWDGAGHYDRTSEAVLRFLRGAQEHPEMFQDDETIQQLRLSAAQMLINIKSYSKASDVLTQIMQQDPDNKNAGQMLARCYMELGDTKKSRELAKQISQKHPDDVAALWTLCICALNQGDTAEAISAASSLADAVKNGHTEGDALLFNCVSELSMSDYTAGFTHNVYSDDTEDPFVRQITENAFLNDYCAAVYYEKQKRDYDLALEHVNKALAVRKDSPRLWYLKGLILFNAEDFEASAQALLQADTLDPNDLSIMYALANTYDALGEYQKAYEYCERVVAKYPNGADHDEDVFGAAPHAAYLKSRLESYVKEGN